MRPTHPLVHRLGDLCRRGLRTLAGMGVLAVVAVAWTLLAGEGPPRPEAPPAAASTGWGHEALADVRERMRAVSPIAEANACGMGASSCFKRHNGTRAGAPKAEKWHSDHRSVNDSCVGCHKGNARLIKAELAHAGMVKDARLSPDLCSNCHKSGNLATLVSSYKK